MTNFWKLIRQRQGLTQEQFAAKTGVNLDSIRRFEQGRANPSAKTAKKVANALGDGVRAVEILVAHHVGAARKAADEGEVDGAALLRAAAKFLQLAADAESSTDAEALRAGADALVKIAGGDVAEEPDEDEDPGEGAATKSSADGGEGLVERDGWGRRVHKLYGDQAEHRELSRRAEKAAVPVERDGFGRAVNKVFGGTA
jgi:transcriptional regulator with XRE-family HTH domain